MPSISFVFLRIFAIFSIVAVNAQSFGFCGSNGGAELGWETPVDAIHTVLGFNSTGGPVDAAGNPILAVIATNFFGFDPDFFQFDAWICGRETTDSGAAQSNFGGILSASDSLCLTASGLEMSNITLSLLPCINDLNDPPVATQSFEWIANEIVGYELIFLGTTAGLPLDPDANTDYTPSLVPATNTTPAYIRLDYTPGAYAPVTIYDTTIVMGLSDD
ncbi:hypothetical protein C8R45DRAFT_970369 [Mycena sanguinolenta]|nr:hypothetical protein C8R45DRAFT_970369 [Mycena sanguinolenta]